MRVVVVGAGVIGLAAAWRLSGRGDDVTLLDPSPGQGASWVAGGMLAPVAEAYQGEEAITRFGVAAAARWPSWRDELAQASGRDPGYTKRGTLVVARDADELALIRPLHDVQVAQGLPAQIVTSSEARRIEPALAPTIRGGLWLADDHQVDNRLYLTALLEAVGVVDPGGGGVVVERERAALVTPSAVTTETGRRFGADEVVVATGAWMPTIEIDGRPLDLPVRPVKGQILRLQATATAVFPTRTIRGLDVYIVPRDHGEIVVGATSEERGFDTTVTAGGVRELLDAAHELVPSLAEAELVETAAGLRPGTPDNAPIIGRVAPGLTLAMGHYRHGVLFSPVTAEAVSRLVHHEPLPLSVQPFSSERFATVQP